jgi:predicted AAA+ superfamily ATPase
LELIKTNKKINFWRTTNKQEIDFIIQDKKLYAIEVKLNFQNVDNKSLKFFSVNYKSKIETIGLKGEKKGKYIWEFVKSFKKR